MPSTLLFSQSGGISLVSGNIFSGTLQYDNGVQLKLAKAAPGLIYVGLPPPGGGVNTSTSGGVFSSGGLTDGMELNPGDAYFVQPSRMTSGILSISLIVPATSSGGRLFWEPQ